MIFLRKLPSDFGAVAVTVSVGDLTLGILKQFTVAQLREFSKQHGVPRGRTKYETIVNLVESGIGKVQVALLQKTE